MNIRDILGQATHKFEAAGISSARLDAEILLAFYLQRDRLDILKNPDLTLDDKPLSGFLSLVSRRLQGEPVAYITGRKNFWDFSLEVGPHVLIPRPDTEIIVEEALEICRAAASPDLRLLDIGTGSGAIALALARELPQAAIVATDISAEALAVAQKNALALNLDKRIDFLHGDLFEPVDGGFDVIVSNPPYISEEDYKTLPDGVRKYEPAIALRAGKHGMLYYEKLVEQAAGFLRKNGWLLLEIGAKQDETVRSLMEATGLYETIAMRRDYAGLPRVIKARRRSIG